MATWITHFIIADKVLEKMPELDRQNFFVGNIAPDCNLENEDFTSFVPSREITHWMSSDQKNEADSDRFYQEYIEKREHQIKNTQEKSFLLGYYAHLIVDAEFPKCMRDEERISSAWARIKKHHELSQKAEGMFENWDSLKRIIPKSERMKEIHTLEAEYLEEHLIEDLTEIFNLNFYPDYIDYLPKGAIVRKIGIMRYFPIKEIDEDSLTAMTKEEYSIFVDCVAEKIVQKISQNNK
ncbi:MAG: zinc dependent phospholipase C family protein [Clostridia bacterium]|nr:zinc dependent phospholipase C family protein [Clostridia bacterium]